MARCKEELRAQGVTALPRTCPEHGIICPAADLPTMPPVEGASVYIAEETRSQHLVDGVRVWAVAWDDLKGHWRNWKWFNKAWAMHNTTLPPEYLEGHEAGYNWTEMKAPLPPPNAFTLEPLPKVIPKKSGVVAQLPKTFGDLRKLVRDYDEGGIPDSAKILITRGSIGSENRFEVDGEIALRLQWWTVEETA